MVYKILVVDDQPDVVNLAKMILEGERYHVATASNGEGALQKAKAEVPDLILLDAVMPDKSGFEVCKILKSQAETRHIPVVMFTALGQDVDRKLSTQAGADSHFIKPFTPDDLLAEVKRQLDQAKREKF